MWFLKRVALYLERLAFDPVENASISLNWFHHVWLLLSNRRKIRRDWLQSLISLQIATDLIESIATAPVLPVFCRCFFKVEGVLSCIDQSVLFNQTAIQRWRRPRRWQQRPSKPRCSLRPSTPRDRPTPRSPWAKRRCWRAASEEWPIAL